ncbi:MAG: flagellar biosynthesis protein FlhF [Chitinivibrionales bacterium]|nr:flagellar biosynthesis protein FlhF [Chitinivibrionales bacterium]MBD3394034.1 flagellar biosynthesis protein FlhF [Chitinivibrionales bacterium]
MRIKKFIADSMKEALLDIKKELGEDAIILKTRTMPKKLFGLASKAQVEVTAAIDETAKRAAPALAPLRVSDPGVYSRPKPSPAMPSYTAPRREAEPATDRFRLLELREDIREVKDLVKSILETGESAAAGGFAGSWAVMYKRLVDAEIKPETAETLVTSIKNSKEIPDAEVEKKFVTVLGKHFPTSGPLKRKETGPLVVAFVGPTGSGKTTTLAKLATHCCVDKKLAVSIITADTYRIAAIEQIRTFADIINIGLQVVFSPDEVPAALAACENDDIVFVDTAGRSQKHAAHMKELEDFCAALRPDETHLVLSATTKDSDLADTMRRYDRCGISRLLFTKLDETSRLGNVFNAVYRSGIPVSYFTAGQGVPDDIELARPGRFVQRLWEGSLV